MISSMVLVLLTAMSLALPIKDFTGGTEIPVSYDVKKDTTYTGSDPAYAGLDIKQELDIDASKFSGIEGFSSINASIGNFGSGEGGIRLEVDDEGVVPAGHEAGDAEAQQIDYLVGLAQLVGLLLGLAAAEGPRELVVILEVYIVLARLLAGVEDELELLSRELEAARRAVLLDGELVRLGGELFHEVHSAVLLKRRSLYTR